MGDVTAQTDVARIEPYLLQISIMDTTRYSGIANGFLTNCLSITF